MIRLLMVIPTLDRSGAEKQFTLLATGLPREEFQVEVVTLTRDGPYAQELLQAGIPLTSLKKRWKFDPFALKQLRKIIQERQPDIIHSWLFAANAAVRLMKPRKSPARIVISERCVDSWKAGWQHALDRQLLPRTDRLLANSQSVAEFYRELGAPEKLIRVIPNGVIPPAPAPATRAEFLQQLQLPVDAKIVGFIGRLAPQKRLKDLLWAAQVLRQADPRSYFLIIGDGPLLADLQEYANQVESAPHVRFLSQRPDAASLLSYFDAFWLASEFEGMSNSLMEAMSVGVPPITSDIPPNRELIRHNEDGFLVKLGDSMGFAQYARKLFEDTSLRNQIGESARKKMAEEFSVQRMIGRHAEMYRELVAP